MAQRLIRRDIEYISQVPVENKTVVETNVVTYSKIYPFVIDNRQINQVNPYYTKVGQLSIPIEPSKDLSGSIFIQAEINNQNYSPMEIKIVAQIKPTKGNVFNTTVTLDNNFASTDFKKVSINVPAADVGTNDKLILFITAKNKGPSSGSYNIINLIYFEKTS